MSALTDKLMNFLGLVREVPKNPDNGPRYHEWKAAPSTTETVDQLRLKRLAEQDAHRDVVTKVKRIIAKRQHPRSTTITKTPAKSLDANTNFAIVGQNATSAITSISNTTLTEHHNMETIGNEVDVESYQRP